MFVSTAELTSDRQEFIRCQRQDPDSADIYKYLENRYLPTDDTNSRAVILNSELYQLHDGLLYRIGFNANARHDMAPQLIFPRNT